jgi:hypothetical protein
MNWYIGRLETCHLWKYNMMDQLQDASQLPYRIQYLVSSFLKHNENGSIIFNVFAWQNSLSVCFMTLKWFFLLSNFNIDNTIDHNQTKRWSAQKIYREWAYQVHTNKTSKINILITLTCLRSTGTYNTEHSVECHEKQNRNRNRKFIVLPYRIVSKSMHLKVIFL